MPTLRFSMRFAFVMWLVLWGGAADAAYGQRDVSAGAGETDSAAVVILEAEALHDEAATSVVEALHTVPGVDVVQTGLGQHAVALRGAGGLFRDDGPLVLVDGRPAALPVLGVNVFGLMPVQRVSLKRVEITRGPAVVRYGPEAHAGAIHFVTKNPFDDPGTAVAVSGGTRHYLSGQLRHAGDVGGTFGYEATAYLARGTDWQLDPSRVASRWGLAYNRTFDSASGTWTPRSAEVAARRLRDDAYQRIGIHGRFTYRPNGRTTVTAQGGYAALTGRMLTEVGALQAQYWGYAFGQLQLRTDGLFAQFVLNNNESGDSYRYGTDAPLVDRGVRYLAEARYRFGTWHGRTDVTVGGTADWTRPRTGRTLMGRYEERDAIDGYGAYVRTRTALAPSLDLALALRGEVGNLDGRIHLAPHARLAYEFAPSHVLHLRYDRAVAPLHAPEHFLDTEAHRQELAGPYTWVHHAHGAHEGVTFETFRRRREAASLLPLPGTFGRTVTVDAVPMAALYRAATARFDRLLADPAARPASVQQLSDAEVQSLIEALQELAVDIAPEATTRGALGLPRATGGYAPAEMPRDVPALRRPITQAIELGYRGPLGADVQLHAGVYYRRTKNAIAPLDVAAPAVYVPAIEQDAEAALAPAIARATSDPDAPLDALLDAMGLTTTEAARLVARLTGRALADTPVAAVQADGVLRPPGVSSMDVTTLLTYRNVERITQAGADVGVSASLTPRLRMDGGVAVAVEAPFGGRSEHRAALGRNAPAVHAHLGVEVAPSAAWSLQASGHYASRFSVRAGFYEGTVPAAYPLDLGLRYDAHRYVSGLQLEFAVQNVLNQQRRSFISAPVLGRMVRARLTYVL